MSWFGELAGRAENLLTNLDEQTGAALRNHNVLTKQKKQALLNNDTPQFQRQKRPIPRSLKTVTSKNPPSPPHRFKEIRSSSPSKVPLIKIPHNKCNLNEGSRTEADDCLDCYGYKPRRYSLPGDLGNMPYQAFISKFGNLEIANSKLTSELNVTNKENKELLTRLNAAHEELNKERKKLENVAMQNHRLNAEKKSLMDHIEQLENNMVRLSNAECSKHEEEKRELQAEISVLRDQNRDLEELVKLYAKQDKERDAVQNKIENELRHAQSTITLLQSEKTKNNNECIRLESEWDAYKIRVKSMLANKDKEIQSLQQGINLTEDTKILVEQIEQLKQERESLSEAVGRVQGEYEDMKKYLMTLENEHNAGQLVVNALREALREERAAKTRAEAACKEMTKNLKSIQLEYGQTIASLRAALLEKESEMAMQDSTTLTTSVRTINSGALNVADFGVKSNDPSEDAEKISYLSKKLVQRQGQIDSLRANNNMLKIQLEKLESKYKSEIQSQSRGQSVVAFHDGGCRQRKVHQTASLTGKVSGWLSVLVRSHPLCRVFVVMYMVCLHIWVFTVITTSTPESKVYYEHSPQILSPNV